MPRIPARKAIKKDTFTEKSIVLCLLKSIIFCKFVGKSLWARVSVLITTKESIINNIRKNTKKKPLKLEGYFPACSIFIYCLKLLHCLKLQLLPLGR